MQGPGRCVLARIGEEAGDLAESDREGFADARPTRVQDHDRARLRMPQREVAELANGVALSTHTGIRCDTGHYAHRVAPGHHVVRHSSMPKSKAIGRAGGATRDRCVGDHRVCRLAAIKSSRRLHRGRQFARRHGRALGQIEYERAAAD